MSKRNMKVIQDQFSETNKVNSELAKKLQELSDVIAELKSMLTRIYDWNKKLVDVFNEDSKKKLIAKKLKKS